MFHLSLFVIAVVACAILLSLLLVCDSSLEGLALMSPAFLLSLLLSSSLLFSLCGSSLEGSPHHCRPLLSLFFVVVAGASLSLFLFVCSSSLIPLSIEC